ncbi:MAG: D-2-hydroxyacid dehydrogenase [Planctomycetaceae bacterium]|nr:D-2-hydroxyacid dehydrogenase [Planctomycetaceae bacterium]MCB9949394.1 D-2-hydroxyacid dehydrogenase [Planctomycetaceae bacterium]
MKIVIHPPVGSQRHQLVQTAAGSASVIDCPDYETATTEIVDATGFIGKLTPELLSRAQRLTWVQSPTASLEHFVFPELVEHPCVLTNMRGLFSDVIADHVLSYMTCVVRNLHLYLRQQMKHVWEPVGGEAARTSYAAGPGEATTIDFAHRRLSDCTVGIVGVGAIGQEIARRCLANGMQVRGVDPHVTEVPNAGVKVWPMERLGELLAESDFVVIAAPHTPQTAGMFGADQFALMKQSAWLINIGRGVIVKLDELTSALQSGTIAGAALDVFETEPLPRDHPLWDMENVLMTPHIAAASPVVPERHLEVLIENVKRHVAGEELLNVVSKRDWY